MKIINIFPLSLVKEKIVIEENLKNKMIKEIQKMVQTSRNNESLGPQDSWTGDTHGFEYLCKNKNFELLFQEIKK